MKYGAIAAVSVFLLAALLFYRAEIVKKHDDAKIIFTGTIQENNNNQLQLEKIEAIKDEEDFVPGFQTYGVILNVVNKQVKGDIKEYVAGAKVRVTLHRLPITTMSIPPQLTGTSIKKVELI